MRHRRDGVVRRDRLAAACARVCVCAVGHRGARRLADPDVAACVVVARGACGRAGECPFVAHCNGTTTAAPPQLAPQSRTRRARAATHSESQHHCHAARGLQMRGGWAALADVLDASNAQPQPMLQATPLLRCWRPISPHHRDPATSKSRRTTRPSPSRSSRHRLTLAAATWLAVAREGAAATGAAPAAPSAAHRMTRSTRRGSGGGDTDASRHSVCRGPPPLPPPGAVPARADRGGGDDGGAAPTPGDEEITLRVSPAAPYSLRMRPPMAVEAWAATTSPPSSPRGTEASVMRQLNHSAHSHASEPTEGSVACALEAPQAAPTTTSSQAWSQVATSGASAVAVAATRHHASPSTSSTVAGVGRSTAASPGDNRARLARGGGASGAAG